MDIIYSARPYYGETEPMHSWAVVEDGAEIATLWADLATGQIMQVETDADRQREGLAAALYHHAVQTVDLYHSPEEHRTPAGHAFALSVGGDTIRLQPRLRPVLAHSSNR